MDNDIIAGPSINLPAASTVIEEQQNIIVEKVQKANGEVQLKKY